MPSPHRLEPPTCSDEVFGQVESSMFHYPALVISDELGVFPFLSATPASAGETAQALNLNERGTEALLAVMVGLGFLEQHQGRFVITDVTRNYLLPDQPYYKGPFLIGGRNQELPNMVRKGLLQPEGQEQANAFYQRYVAGEAEPEIYRYFTESMHANTLGTAMIMTRWGDFEGVTHLLDIGGGSGSFCIALAMRYPEMRFTVLELPQVCPVADRIIADFGLSDRIDCVSLDMFSDDWPSGYDAVFFSNVFHNWEPDKCRLLAQKGFDMLPSGGRIYLHEALLNETRDGPLGAAVGSLVMLLYGTGRQYTFGELEALMNGVGFESVRPTSTANGYSLVDARKP